MFSHFDGIRLMKDTVPNMPEGPYPDDWAAVHHIIDEGWMYSLRFDDGVTSAGFLLTPRGVASSSGAGDAASLWRKLLERYPTLATAFADATPIMPIAFLPAIQHRLTRAAGERWALMPHAYAFVDPLFSTGIAWGLRTVERLALAFESVSHGRRVPDPDVLTRYETALAAEADQIDLVVAGAYEAMSHFDMLAAQAMLYFAAVSFAEANQRLIPKDSVAWNGFLGVGDRVLGPLPREALRRLREITQHRGEAGTAAERRTFVEWITRGIAPATLPASLTEPEDLPGRFRCADRTAAPLGMTRAEVLEGLPALRGMGAEPALTGGSSRQRGLLLPDAELLGRDRL